MRILATLLESALTSWVRRIEVSLHVANGTDSYLKRGTGRPSTVTIGPLRYNQVSWHIRNSRCVDDVQDLSIRRIYDIARHEVNAELMEGFGGIERQVLDLPVTASGRAETLTRRLLGLEDQVQRVCVVREVELRGKAFEVDLLRVIVILRRCQ